MAIANICTNKAIVYRPVRCRPLVNRFVYTPRCQIRAALIALLSVYAFLSKLVTHTHPFNGPLSGTTRVRRYQKGKNQSGFYLTVSGSGISLAICKSASCSKQITMPGPHQSVFYRPDAIPAAQRTASKH